MNKPKKVAVGADHRGIELKEILIRFLTKHGFEAADLGTNSPGAFDYPDIAFPLSERVARGEFDRGILVCMSGTGMAICANKVRGIRAAICDSVEHAKLSREHNDANVLILGSQFVSDETACGIALEWLNMPFEGGRHENRVRKISEYENRK